MRKQGLVKDRDVLPAATGKHRIRTLGILIPHLPFCAPGWCFFQLPVRIQPWSNRISILTRRDNRELTFPLCHMRTQREGDRLQASKTAHQKLNCQHIDQDFLASRTVRNTFLLFKPLSVWYFVTTAQAD